jgi:peptidyl-prolyl cis-trans isomerase SurA
MSFVTYFVKYQNQYLMTYRIALTLAIVLFLKGFSTSLKAHYNPKNTDCVSCPLHVNDDPVLFTVNGKEVRVSEFVYIYTKHNGDKADFSEASLRDYLQLYINFKLQVAKANDMGLDKNPEVQREQNQYKRQLSSTYLTDREITEKLVKEAFEWSKEDRRISHILFTVNETASETETREAYEKAKRVKNQLTADNFAELVKQYSDDNFSKNTGGDLGYFTTLLLPYELEKAMYNTQKGQNSEIVRSKYGFHIIRVTEVRPAYGQVQLAHILVRGNDDAAKKQVDSLYNVLKTTDVFEELATKFSMDNSTKSRGGIIGWVGINKFPADFEKAVFDLSKDGAISAPVQTSAGWHILKRIKAMKNPTYQEVKGELTNKIKQNERFKIVQDTLTERIKREAGYKLDDAVYKDLKKILEADANFLQGRWNPENNLLGDERAIFTLGDKNGTIKEFAQLAQRSPNERFSMNPRTLEAAIDRIMGKLVAQKCLEFEETQLDKKYPEFKALMREYEEGILLFEVKKQLVWDKASSDEEGLKKFYESNKSKYQWKERAKATFYTVKSKDEKLLKSIKKAALKGNADQVKASFNKDNAVVQSSEGNFERGKNKELDELKWKAGTLSKGYTKEDVFYFAKIESVTPATSKSLEEARGYVVADYQDQLEKDLINSLRKDYKVEINENTLKGLVKK